jgi:hypothetical protein
MMEQFAASAREQEDIFERNQREYNEKCQLNGEVTMQPDCIQDIQACAKYCGFELTQTDILRFTTLRLEPAIASIPNVMVLYDTFADDDIRREMMHNHYMWDFPFKKDIIK